MLALNARVVDAVWAAVLPLLPPRPPDRHPLGCHRRRIPDRDCFEAILFRLVTGCSWDVAGRLGRGSETTLRARRDQWLAAGVFDQLVEQAIKAYDRIIGLDLDDIAVDGSLHKAPMGGEGTGPNPADRAKRGWKWSIATDRHGTPIGWCIDGAQRQDCKLLGRTLSAVDQRGLLQDIGTLHLDRGYDYRFIREDCAAIGLHDVLIARRRRPGKGRHRTPTGRGLRWPVERTNSWLSNFGQLRRNTDRHSEQRLGQLALAITLILTIKLCKWADRWNP
jgi:transposase